MIRVFWRSTKEVLSSSRVSSCRTNPCERFISGRVGKAGNDIKGALGFPFTLSEGSKSSKSIAPVSHRQFSNTTADGLLDYHPDGMPRYPTITSANGLLRCLDWMGTISFASSGTILAGQVGMDSLGCTLVGAITATGGGTIRDLLIGNTPVFWMAEVEYLWLILATIGVTFCFYKDEWKDTAIGENGIIFRVTDAVGLGAFACIGAQNGIRKSLPGVVCVLCGMMTATFGGVMRDVLCSRPVRIMHSHAEIYAVTALTGSMAYVGLRQLCFSPAVSIGCGVMSAATMRYWATTQNVKLPTASWLGKPQVKVEEARIAAIPQEK